MKKNTNGRKKNGSYCSYSAAWYCSYYSKLKKKEKRKEKKRGDKVLHQISTVDKQ